MKSLFLGLVLLTSMSFAQSANQSILQMHNQNNASLAQGNMEVGGSVGIRYSNYSGADTYLYPRAEYFFTDELAVGGTLSYYSNKFGSGFGFGPSASYYFWKKDNLAAYAGGSVLYDTYSSSNSGSFSLNAKTGMNYFLTHDIAFGPQLSWSDLTSGSSNLDLTFTFAIYL